VCHYDDEKSTLSCLLKLQSLLSSPLPDPVAREIVARSFNLSIPSNSVPDSKLLILEPDSQNELQESSNSNPLVNWRW